MRASISERFDLLSANDKGFTFNYTKSGHADRLVFYCLKKDAIYIIKGVNDKFEPVYAQGNGGSGIGDITFRSTQNLMLSSDYEGSGCTGHFSIYTPGYRVHTLDP